MTRAELLEKVLSGWFAIVKIMQRLPEAVTDPSQVKVELERGERYAFEVDALKKENGFATAWMTLREPVPIE